MAVCKRDLYGSMHMVVYHASFYYAKAEKEVSSPKIEPSPNPRCRAAHATVRNMWPCLPITQ